MLVSSVFFIEVAKTQHERGISSFIPLHPFSSVKNTFRTHSLDYYCTPYPVDKILHSYTSPPSSIASLIPQSPSHGTKPNQTTPQNNRRKMILEAGVRVLPGPLCQEYDVIRYPARGIWVRLNVTYTRYICTYISNQIKSHHNIMCEWIKSRAHHHRY